MIEINNWQINNWHVIFAASFVTIAIRLSGYFIMEHLPLTPFVKRFLNALPGAILVSTVVPICIKTGGVAIIGLIIAIITMILVRKDYAALFMGLGTISLLRYLGY